MAYTPVVDEPLLLIGEDVANLLSRSSRLVFIAKGKYWVNNHAHILKPTNGLLEYYCELLELYDFYIWVTGSAQPKLTSENLMNIKVIVPPTSDQTAIANYLDTKTAEIDQTIANKEALINLFEEEKKALINEAVTKGLPAEVAAKAGLNSKVPLKPSGIDWLGEIPEHWEVKKLKYVVNKIGSGVTPKGGSDVYEIEGIPLLRSQNIYNDGLRLDDVAYITEEIHNSMKGSKLCDKDILLNITGASIGRCFYYDGDLNEANVNQHVCIIRLMHETSNFHYFRFCIISEVIISQISNSQTGSGREGLNFESLGNFYFPFPPLKEQTAIVQYIETETTNTNEKINLIKQEVELLKEYRQALIFEAVTGKICVLDSPAKNN